MKTVTPPTTIEDCIDTLIAGDTRQRLHAELKEARAMKEVALQMWRRLAKARGELPIIPVLQGWTMGDYYDHVESYERAGVDLTKLTTVGIGSVCRRQNTQRVSLLVAELVSEGIPIHGFGFKMQGLGTVGRLLTSSDSMAWSYAARRDPPLPECVGSHINCANCPIYALEWRDGLLASIERSDRQL